MMRKPTIPKSEWIARWHDWLDTLTVLALQSQSPERVDEIGDLIKEARQIICQVADEVYSRQM